MSTDSLDRVAVLRDAFGEHLEPTERDLLRRIQELFQSVLGARRGFGIVVEIVAEKLSDYLDGTPIPSFHGAFDRLSFQEMLQKQPVRMSNADAPLTEREETFCRDVIGVIDFTVQNGIGFGLIASALAHDLVEICRAGGMDKALFIPKVSGYSKYSPEQFGSSEAD